MRYRYLDLITILSVTFLLISDVTAPRLISLCGFTVSVTVLYFPFTYIFADVLTEVYGYAVAKGITWYSMLASILAGLTYQIVTFFPDSNPSSPQTAYTIVLGAVPLTLLGGWISVWSGSIVNSIVMAKMKVAYKGKYLWLRTITSTILGESINTCLFYLIALSRVLGGQELFSAIITASIIKILVEASMTPCTYFIIAYLKRAEGLDHYDYNTDFNPFNIFNK